MSFNREETHPPATTNQMMKIALKQAVVTVFWQQQKKFELEDVCYELTRLFCSKKTGIEC